MKPTKYNTYRFPILGLLFILLPSLGQAKTGPGCGFDEYVKTYEERFDIHADGQVNLLNRHGKIMVTHHDRDEVDIRIRVVVEARNQEAANRVFDRIGIEMEGNRAQVSAQTSIRVNDSWEHGEFKVMYEVRLPTTVSLNIDAKHCDVFVDDHEGVAHLLVKYGDLRAESFGDHSQIEVNYGEADLDRLGATAQVKVTYGEINIADAGYLDLYLRYSEAQIDRVSSLDVDTRYDELDIRTSGDVLIKAGYTDFTIGEVTNIRARSNYSDYEIESVRGSVDIETSYGDVEIDNLLRGFQEVKIRGNYSDVEIGLEDGYGYQFSGYASHGSLSVPSSLSVNRRENEGSSKSIEGRFTSNGGGGSIRIWTNYGDIDIK